MHGWITISHERINMNKIDTHLHFWNLNNKINNWVLQQTWNQNLKKNFLPEDLLWDKSLHGFVHIEAHDSIIPTIDEIKWLDIIMKMYPNTKYAHIAFADITLPVHEFANIILQIKQFPQVKGVRHILSHHPKHKYSPCDKDLSQHKNIPANLTCLKQNNLIFDCQMYPYQLKNLLTHIIASEITCIVDHFALPALNNKDDHNLWQDLIIDLGKIKHIHLKLSGLDMFLPKSDFIGILDFCLQNFSHKNLIYGSNYPVSYTNDYDWWFNYLNKSIKNTKIKEQIFYSNALKLFFNQNFNNLLLC